MSYAVIRDGVVVNLALADPAFAALNGWIEAPAHVSPGWLFDGTDWSAPVAPVPETVTLPQLLAQLVVQGVITPAERLAWAQRTALPAVIEGVLGQMPSADADEIRSIAFVMTSVERHHPAVVAMAEAVAPGDTAAVDQFFRDAAAR